MSSCDEKTHFARSCLRSFTGYFSFVLPPNSLATAIRARYNQLSDARGNVSLAGSRLCRQRKPLFDNSHIGTEGH
jgi:hypothetical protein